ncbi:MAG: hypothetical protein ACLP1Y_04940 [Candidatus Acidiferrales bacterium]
MSESSQINLGAPGRRIPWTLVLAFFLFFNFLYLLTSTGRVRTIDEVSADFEAESLYLRGSTAVPQAVQSDLFYGVFDRFGRPQTPYAPGQSVAALPWFAVGHWVARWHGVPAAAHDLVSDFFLVASSGTFSAAAAALVLLIFLRLGVPAKTSLTAAGILALATPVAAYSGWFFSEPLAAALLLGAAAILFLRAPSSAAQAVAAGALFAALVWVRPTHIIVAPVFLVALLLRDGKRAAGPAVVFSAIAGFAGAAYLWRNTFLFGDPFNFGYPAVAETGKALNTFHTPFATGLYGFLLSPGKSIFVFAPPILLAIWGLRRLWRRDRALAVVTGGAPLVYLFFFATFTQWEGGYCYGPRYLVPALALLSLGLGPALDGATRRTRVVALSLFAVGFLVQAIGLATSFIQVEANGAYYDESFNYRMNFEPILAQAKLFWHYATTSAPAPIGRGFDRWWVLLSKAQVSHGLLCGIGLLELAGLVVSAILLRKSYLRAAALER